MSPPLLLVTIDTEEDAWGVVSGELYVPSTNVHHLPVLQEVFDRHGARATYFVTRQPLLDPRAVAALGHLAARDDVEIAAHCHPWNTPPLVEGRDRREPWMHRLSRDMNRDKIRTIQRGLGKELGVEAAAFRAGRWGFGPTVAQALIDCGIPVDSSVTPHLDWTRHGGPDHSGAPLRPYRFHPAEPLRPADDGPLLEMPVSIGFLSTDQASAARMRRRMERSVLHRWGVVGALDRIGVWRRRWLTPEQFPLEDLCRLADRLVSAGVPTLDLTMHSSCLLPGATPFVYDRDDRDRLLRRIDGFLRYASEAGFVFSTVSAAAGEVGRAA